MHACNMKDACWIQWTDMQYDTLHAVYRPGHTTVKNCA